MRVGVGDGKGAVIHWFGYAGGIVIVAVGH